MRGSQLYGTMSKCARASMFLIEWYNGMFTFYVFYTCLILTPNALSFVFFVESCVVVEWHFLLDHRAMMVKNMVATILDFMKICNHQGKKRITFCIELYKDSISLYKQLEHLGRAKK